MGQVTDEGQKMPFADKSRGTIDMSDDKPERLRILDEAYKATGEDRNSTYGDPYANLDCQARMVRAYMHGRCGKDINPYTITAHDIAIINVLIKVGRIATGKYHRDNYVDGSAYMAIAGECYREEEGLEALVSEHIRPVRFKEEDK